MAREWVLSLDVSEGQRLGEFKVRELLEGTLAAFKPENYVCHTVIIDQPPSKYTLNLNLGDEWYWLVTELVVGIRLNVLIDLLEGVIVPL